jgi:predicted MPP superfamily phosphohydrolase
MTRNARIMTFVLIALSVWTAMHLYVASRFWTLSAGAGPAWHRLVAVVAVVLWASFPLSQLLARTLARVARPFEIVGSTWIGLLFLLLACLLAADILTGFGWLLPALARLARQVAVAAAIVLCMVALVQGLRPPEVRRHDVAVRGLEPAFAGLRIVQLSDLHLGPFLGPRWVENRVAQVRELRPDLIVITGDLVDRDARLSERLVPSLRGLHARLGVWGVTGNHEFYAGLEESVRVFESSGIRLLRDTAVEVAPGLVLAGVDDLTARRQFGIDDHPVERTLSHRPPGATIFLCHSPWQTDRAAALGADVMLSGHTHAGQIWPFVYLVRMAYPYVQGRFSVNGMTLIVSRGTGFWGPPMRLFRRAEITLITLARG